MRRWRRGHPICAGSRRSQKRRRGRRVRWTGIALAAIAAGVVGIAGWQIWEAKQLEIPKWMDTDRADCRTWDPYPQRGETVSWSGECQSGKAEGAGTLTWHYTDPAGNPLVETSAGKLTAGKW